MIERQQVEWLVITDAHAGCFRKWMENQATIRYRLEPLRNGLARISSSASSGLGKQIGSVHLY